MQENSEKLMKELELYQKQAMEFSTLFNINDVPTYLKMAHSIEKKVDEAITQVCFLVLCNFPRVGFNDY